MTSFVTDYEANNRDFALAFEQSAVAVDAPFNGVVEVKRYPEAYTGAYSVEPVPTRQTLETADRYMEDNVTVNAVIIREYRDADGNIITVIGDE